MFAHTQEAFGQFVVHHIKDPKTKTGFSIVPAQGGIILDIRFKDISIIDGYQTPIEVDLNNWGKSVLLYPFPNRLKDGQYQWEGQTYQFPLNDDQTQNALHGLGMTQAMNITKVVTDDQSGTLICQYSNQGKHDYYPFLFHFSAAFTITESGFAVELSAKNQDQKAIPFGYGWHPYFSLSEKIEEVELQLPNLDLVGIDARMIPTGKRYAFDDFLKPKKIGTTVLDNCFATQTTPDNKIHIHLKGSKGSLDYWQENQTGAYQFVQLFTPPMRKSIAIEPMTCNVDAFNNQDGLITLNPGESSSARFGFNFRPA